MGSVVQVESSPEPPPGRTVLRSVRVVSTLVVSGLMFVVVAIALSLTQAHAADERGQSAYRYTDHPQRAGTGRVLPIYIDRDFDAAEYERVVLAIKQWNHVLNGFLQMRPQNLPDNPSAATLTQIRRSGGWIVARVDSRHPVARQPEARQALALTVGGNGGFVYVISDRFALRDLTGVMMHEFGHVLGAGHDNGGHLMAPVYDPGNGRCIDRGAVSMVAQAQRLPLNQLNWCVGPGLEQRSDPREARAR